MPKFSVMPKTGYNEFALFEKLALIGPVTATPIAESKHSYEYQLSPSISIEAIGTFNVSKFKGVVETINIYEDGVLKLEVSDISMHLFELGVGITTGFVDLLALIQEREPNYAFGNKGNDVLGSFHSSRFFGRAGNDTFLDFVDQKNKFDGETGSDTVDYSTNFGNSGVTVYLANAAKNEGGAAGDTYRSIENVVGSQVADTIVGTARNNILAGGLGADALDGGDGVDLASYQNSASGVMVSIGDPGLNTGEAAGDTFANMEGVIGSDHNDTLYGGDNDDIIYGGFGDDIIYGGIGDDELWGDREGSGDKGADLFVFTRPLADTKFIMDFDGLDHIQISRFGFGLHPQYQINEGTTLIIEDFDPSALTNSPSFLVEVSTGDLYFDADGNGSGDAEWIANFEFDGQAHLDANDFVIVD